MVLLNKSENYGDAYLLEFGYYAVVDFNDYIEDHRSSLKAFFRGKNAGSNNHVRNEVRFTIPAVPTVC